MTITTVTTLIEPSDPRFVATALEAPFEVAAAHGAHLIAVIMATDGALTEAPDGAFDAENDAAAKVKEAAARRGIDVTVRTRSSFAYGVGEVLADHLRVSDLGILTLKPNAGPGQRIVLNASLFDSGRPVILLRQGDRLTLPLARVVVGWDATPASVRAVHAALPFIKSAHETVVVTVTDDKALRSGQSGIELTHLLSRHGAKATFAAIEKGGRSVIEVLANSAREGANGLLVMGAVRHSPVHSVVFGSATAGVMAEPPVPAFLAA